LGEARSLKRIAIHANQVLSIQVLLLSKKLIEIVIFGNKTKKIVERSSKALRAIFLKIDTKNNPTLLCVSSKILPSSWNPCKLVLKNCQFPHFLWLQKFTSCGLKIQNF